MEVSIHVLLWLCTMKKMTIILKIQSAEGKQTSEPEKAHSTGEFVIVTTELGNHVLCRFASSLSNVIIVRQAGSYVGRQKSDGI